MTLDLPDFKIRPATMVQPASLKVAMAGPFWQVFFAQTANAIFEAGGFIVDIGGGLRLDAGRGDREDPAMRKMFGHYLTHPAVQYRVTDYTDQYHPDFVEDIHRLSFASDSVDGLFCLAVLEHVYDPKRACEEITRVLKPGHTALLYVPFLFRYHATNAKDYRDYYRYTKDGIAYLFRECGEVTVCPVRGIFESLLSYTPLETISSLAALLRMADWGSKRMRAVSSRQTSGYFIRIRK